MLRLNESIKNLEKLRETYILKPLHSDDLNKKLYWIPKFSKYEDAG